MAVGMMVKFRTPFVHAYIYELHMYLYILNVVFYVPMHTHNSHLFAVCALEDAWEILSTQPRDVAISIPCF